MRQSMYSIKGSDLMALDTMNVAAPIRVSTREMSAEAVLSTDRQDREGDVVNVAGVDFEDHRRNPVVLLEHGVGGWPLPIGTTEDPTTGEYTVKCFPEAGEITQKTFFSQRSALAEQIFELVNSGTMRGNSLGFDPWQVQPYMGADGRQGKYVVACGMIEASWCTLPVNPDCLSEMKSVLCKGRLCGRPLHASLKSLLTRHAPERLESGKRWNHDWVSLSRWAA